MSLLSLTVHGNSYKLLTHISAADNEQEQNFST